MRSPGRSRRREQAVTARAAADPAARPVSSAYAGYLAAPPLLLLVKQVELAIRARLDEIVRPAGLTALQYTALTVLERHADMSAAQLARASFVTSQSISEIITALEAAG